MKSITVIGRGTVGCLAVAYFLKNTNWDITWAYDPDIPTTSVGEGTNPFLPIDMTTNLDWYFYDLIEMGGTVKYGVLKEGWANQDEEFLTPIPIHMPALHFSAVDFQAKVLKTLKDEPRITISEGNIDIDQVTTDYVYASTGTPTDFSSCNMAESVSLNSAYVVQCHWNMPEFLYTLAIARPWGWVFGIPLQKRCSIGYIYNDNFADEDEIVKDLEYIFNKWNLKPSNDIQRLKFKNYCKKENFSEDFAYGGNSSFFLEPLEAASTVVSSSTYKLAHKIWMGEMSVEDANKIFTADVSDTEAFLALHYFVKAKFDTPYWDYASEIARLKIEKEIKSNSRWAQHLKAVLDNPDKHKTNNEIVGSASSRLYAQTIEKLGIREDLLKLF